jgi:AraC-like DNA-binding protein
MNAQNFEFSSVHDETLLESLSSLLGTEIIKGVVSVPPELGKGSVVRKEFDPGLVLVCWNFQLNADIVFVKKMTPSSEEGRSFFINYLISVDNILMKSPSLKQKFNLNGSLNVLFLPDDADLLFEIKAGTSVKVVTVSVRPGWLKREFDEMGDTFSDYLHQMIHAEKPSVFMESSTPEEFKRLGDMLNNSSAIPNGILNLKPRVMTLVADFFSRIYNTPILDVLESKVLHYQKMQEVEQILKNHIEKSLPDIETISRMVAISVSTLKRHFRAVYGMGVYEYYLTLKMEHAKRLLLEKDVTVNEIAALLHYEKVSSFIDMFKKHQGYSPGTLRRRAS